MARPTRPTTSGVAVDVDPTRSLTAALDDDEDIAAYVHDPDNGPADASPADVQPDAAAVAALQAADWATVERLTKGAKVAARLLTTREAGILVKWYYMMQEQRIRAGAQFRTRGEGEPNDLVTWMTGNYQALEDDIKKAMAIFVPQHRVGRWLLSITGIGPVLAAGLMAHVKVETLPPELQAKVGRVERTPSISALWSFAGFNPEARWTKGMTRPWNAELKTLAWKCAHSFVFTKNNPKSFYGPYFSQAKAAYLAKDGMVYDEATAKYLEIPGAPHGFADRAAHILATRNFGADTLARGWYERGLLPPAHIQAMAERKVAKLFLSHLFLVLWDINHPGVDHHGAKLTWAQAHGGHVDMIPPPGWPCE